MLGFATTLQTDNTNILAAQMQVLVDQLSTVPSDNYDKQLDLLTQQNQILTSIKNIEAQALQTTISQVESINASIYSLQGGSLSPGTSMAFMSRRYDQLLADAQAGLNPNALNNLLNFIPDFAQFMKTYDLPDYAQTTTSITKDLQDLKDGLTGGKTLTDLYNELDSINTSLTTSVGGVTFQTISGQLADIILALGGDSSVITGLRHTTSTNNSQSVTIELVVDGKTLARSVVDNLGAAGTDTTRQLRNVVNM